MQMLRFFFVYCDFEKYFNTFIIWQERTKYLRFNWYRIWVGISNKRKTWELSWYYQYSKHTGKLHGKIRYVKSTNWCSIKRYLRWIWYARARGTGSVTAFDTMYTITTSESIKRKSVRKSSDLDIMLWKRKFW